MRLRLVCALSALFWTVGTGLLASDWPQWRGPKRDGVSTETGLLPSWPPAGPKLLWSSYQVNGKKGVGRSYSSVVVAGGRIFTMGDRDRFCYVLALDEATGRELWATKISTADGDGPRCTPTVDGDRIYAVSRQGVLACLSASKGDLLWQKDYERDFGGSMMSGWGYSESPLVDGAKLICTPGGDNAAVVALDKVKGSLLWRATVPKAKRNNNGAGYASLVVAEAGSIRQYITLLGSGLIGVEANTGRFLWRYDRIANGTANIPTAIVRDDLVFCSTGYGTGSALLRLVPVNGGVVAREEYFLKGDTLQNHHGGVVRVGDYVYGGHGHNEGHPFCLDMKRGRLMWGPTDSVGEGSAAVVYADGRLIFRYQDGVIALIEATPKAYHLVGQFTPPSANPQQSFWSHPVVANGRLYLRDNQTLLCYDVRR
jgi:outer membrane protein assembly factor BamB